MGEFYVAADWLGATLLAVALTMVVLGPRDVHLAIGIFCVAAVLTMFRWFMWSFTTDTSMVPRALVGALVGATLLGGLPSLIKWARDRETPPPVQSSPLNGHNLDYKFTVNCDWGLLHDITRSDGKKVFEQQIVHVPQSQDPPFVGSGSFISSGSSFKAPVPPSIGYTCHRRNDSEQVVTGAYMTMKIWLKKLTKSADGKDKWNTVFEGDFVTPILTLRPLEEDYSLLTNYSEYFVVLKLPEEIKVRVAGSNSFESVKRTPSDNEVSDFLSFNPRTTTADLPTPSIPAVIRLEQPEQK